MARIAALPKSREAPGQTEVASSELREENLRLRKELNKKYSFSNIIGNSRKMQEVFYLITHIVLHYHKILK